MENEIKSKKPRLLLHSCCGPCSTAVIERLKDDFDLTIFYYNPNIYPEKEYVKRKNTQLKYLEILRKQGIDIGFLDSDYEAEKFYKVAKGLEAEKEGGKRCEACFKLRLKKTAEAAAAHGFSIFGTTLTVSPHKNAELINRLGEEISASLNVKFLVADFKKKDGYKRSVALSKENDLYRQTYCGCKFSLESSPKPNLNQ